MSDNSITRVNYFEGQFLRTQDFTDEQAYHVAMRRRHNITHHTWGIVSGLELVQEDGNFSVQPGVAVDGYGRELVLPQKQALASTAFIDKGSKELDVWLIYSLAGSDAAPAGYGSCGKGNGKGGQSFYRLQETAQAVLEIPDPDFPNRRSPEGVTISDRSFNATRTPPDSPQSYWPVFLGQIINDPANPKEPYTVRLDDRPYVGLIGELIEGPSGRTRVQVGNELDDARRFIVFTRDDSAAGGSQQWLSRLEIDDQGAISVFGDASIYGNLVMGGGAIEFEAGTARSRAVKPWNMYHLSGEEVAGGDELRIEMAGGTSGKNRVVIGAWFKGPDETGQEKEMFHPCLTIRDDSTVEISGNLVVNGRLSASSVTGAQFSAASRNAATSALMSGILATSSRLPELSTAPAATDFRRAKASTSQGATLADNLAADQSLIASFAERMRSSHPIEFEMLVKELA